MLGGTQLAQHLSLETGSSGVHVYPQQPSETSANLDYTSLKNSKTKQTKTLGK